MPEPPLCRRRQRLASRAHPQFPLAPAAAPGVRSATVTGRPLTGRTALITGAAGGIGSAYARGLAEAGAAVVLADIRTDAAARAARAIAADGHRAIHAEIDVTSESSWATAVSAVAGELGGIDISVNNAALMAEITTSDMLEITVDEWDRVHRVNLTGPLLGIRAVVPGMRERGWGRIINQSSA